MHRSSGVEEPPLGIGRGRTHSMESVVEQRGVREKAESATKRMAAEPGELHLPFSWPARCMQSCRAVACQHNSCSCAPARPCCVCKPSEAKPAVQAFQTGCLA